MMPSIEQAARNNWKKLLERVRHLESLPRSRFSTALRFTAINTTLVHGEDGTLFVDTSGGARTITLPASTNQGGRIFIVMDSSGDAGTNAITVNTTGGETINGAATASISDDYGALILQTDASNWFIIGAVGAASSLITRIQEPPTTTAWLDNIIPDSVGDGSGTLMQNITGNVSTVFFIDFSIATASTQITSFAPAGAKWAIGTLSVTDTAGVGNDTNVLIAPKAAENPPTQALFSHIASAGGITQSVWLQMDANQIVAFKSTGPAGSFLSKSVFFLLYGYST